MSFKVMREQCQTCIFGGNSPITAARFAQLRAAWEREGVVQACHHATIQAQTIGCRGHYEAARRGVLPHPITAIMAQLGLNDSSLKTSDLMQIAERLGWVEFVSSDDETSQDSEG